MFKDTYDATANTAAAKVSFMKKNPAGFFILSMLAGAYIGFGVLLAFTIGGLLNGQPYAKVVMGLSFGVALSLVVIAGAELFTGNNLVLSAGVFKGTVKMREALGLWLFCWVGNACGSILLAFIYKATGLGTGDVAAFMANAALGKMTAGPGALIARGILCNILVCLAVWSANRCKSDSGKLIMIFWCLFAFITTGFEHSVANMTLLTIALLTPAGTAVSIGGWFYNLLLVTLGNMIGGIVFVSLPRSRGSGTATENRCRPRGCCLRRYLTPPESIPERAEEGVI